MQAGWHYRFRTNNNNVWLLAVIRHPPVRIVTIIKKYLFHDLAIVASVMICLKIDCSRSRERRPWSLSLTKTKAPYGGRTQGRISGWKALVWAVCKHVYHIKLSQHRERREWRRGLIHFSYRWFPLFWFVCFLCFFFCFLFRFSTRFQFFGTISKEFFTEKYNPVGTLSPASFVWS